MERCALNSNHTSEEWAAECPLLGRNRAERIATWKARSGGAATTLQGSLLASSPARTSPVDSDRVSSPEHRDEQAWERARGGRPRKHATARDRQRAYRQRQKQAA